MVDMTVLLHSVYFVIEYQDQFCIPQFNTDIDKLGCLKAARLQGMGSGKKT